MLLNGVTTLFFYIYCSLFHYETLVSLLSLEIRKMISNVFPLIAPSPSITFESMNCSS
jgi:hypothetical protein